MNYALCAFLIGFVAGLRTMTPLAAASLAAWTGRLALGRSWLSFFAHPVSVWVFCVLAVGEWIADKLPFIPSRKQAFPFAARIVSGGLTGAAVGVPHQMAMLGAVLGVGGAVAGTLGGYELRARLARGLGRDLPAALIEDAIAVGAAVLVYALL